MKKTLKAAIFICILFFGFVNIASAQISFGGIPPSFESTLKSSEIINPEIVPVDFTIDRLRAIEYKNRKNTGAPPQMAKAIEVDFDMNYNGKWVTLLNGQLVWQLPIIAENALAIMLSYDAFYLPEGAQLYIYNNSRTHILGAYTHETNPNGGSFSTEMVAGDEIILEYVPQDNDAKGEGAYVSIDKVGYVYNFVTVDYLTTGSQNNTKYGESGSCMVNVNCEEGDDWQIEKKGVCKMFQFLSNGSSGAGWYICTGSLINNTAQDLTPYVISAYHCYDGAVDDDLAKWQFLFHYESAGCSNAEPTNVKTLTGAVFKAGTPTEGGSDGLLIELTTKIPESWDVYYNGWNRTNVVETGTSVSIHHPSGDIKKISTFNNYITSNWHGEVAGAQNAHWLLAFINTQNGHGVTEGGSSGSPMFNPSHKLIGTLTGGNSNCVVSDGTNFYGKLWYHWDQYGDSPETQMKTWLDPLGLGITTLNGLEINAYSPRVSVNSNQLVFEDATAINTPTDSSIVLVTSFNVESFLMVSSTVNFEVSNDGYDWDSTTTIDPEGGNLFVRFIPPALGYFDGLLDIFNDQIENVSVYLKGSSCPSMDILPTTIENTELGTNINIDFSTNSGVAPYTYSLFDGELPKGIELSENGSLSGTSSESGLFNFTLMVTDANGCMSTKEYKMFVICHIVREFPYTEGFEQNEIPGCWTEEYVSSDVSWKFQNGGSNGNSYPDNAYDGAFNACFTGVDYNKNTTKLISPQMDLTNIQNPALSFWHAQYDWFGDKDELRIFYKTSVISDWNLIDSSLTAVDEWRHRSILLPNPSNEYYVAFEGRSNYGYGVVIDNVSINSIDLLTDKESIELSISSTSQESNVETINITSINIIDSIKVTCSQSYYVSIDNEIWNTEVIISPEGGTLYVKAIIDAETQTEGELNIASSGLTKTVLLQTQLVGINDNFSNIQVAVHPNPFIHLLNVTNITTPTTVAVANVIGQKVFNKSTNKDFAISTNNWKSGIYFITIKTEHNSNTYKIIKK